VAAWGFFLFRVLHSVVHCTFNFIPLRFALYVIFCRCALVHGHKGSHCGYRLALRGMEYRGPCHITTVAAANRSHRDRAFRLTKLHPNDFLATLVNESPFFRHLLNCGRLSQIR